VPGGTRLFCFPHGGAGSSAFDGWAAHLPAAVQLLAVRPPGRAHRLREPPIASLPELVAAALDGLRDHLAEPFFFYGQCLGALVAFEVCRRLGDEGWPLPRGLMVAGYPAPHLPPSRRIHHLPDEAFLEEIVALGGFSQDQLTSPGVLETALPALRADCRASETYVYRPRPRLACELVALGGREDGLVSRAELQAWHVHTSGRFRVHLFEGGHFFMVESRAAVLSVVGAELASAA